MIYRIFKILFVFILIIGMMFIPAPPSARAAGPWYVSSTGSDENDCLSPATPCATINNAISLATAGDTILVAVGTYTGSGNEVVLIDKDITLSGGWETGFQTQSGHSTIDGGGVRTGIFMVLHNPTIVAAVERFTIQNGFATYGSPTAGGGIVANGNLTLAETIVENNQADYGGGIYSAQTSILNNSVIRDNTGNGTGGGIYNDGTLTLNGTTVSGNTSAGGGGGIRNANSSGMLILNNSILSENTGSDGGAIYNDFGDTVILNQSTINDNTGGADGGGIYIYGGVLILNNSTLSGNSATDRGGGISIASGTVSINSSTLSGNTTTSNIYGGGGIFNSGATVTLRNSLLAGNTTSAAGPDCNGFNSLDSAGYNLIGDSSSCSFLSGTGDLMDINPNLGPLMGPAGSPKYHPLFAGSPAIDAANPAGCTDQDDNALATDQRGAARAGACDIGAYEYTTSGLAVSLSTAGRTHQISITNLAFAQPLQAAALDSQGSPVSGVTIDFTAPGVGPGGTFADTAGNTTSVSTDANGVATTSTFTANNQAGSYIVTASATGLGSVDFHLEQIAGPPNDNFANTMDVGALPSATAFDTSLATFESGEPSSCGYPSPPYKTLWFAFMASQDGSVAASIQGSNFSTFIGIYMGTDFNNLEGLGCGQYSNLVTFQAVAGETYYFQVGGYYGESGIGTFQLDIAPLPNVGFFYSPSLPSIFDTIQFCSSSSDPANVGIESFTWDFGDGATATDGCSDHKYGTDGDYAVQHSVTTYDGRSASTSQLVSVRTHDVSITKVAAPKAASTGQTKAITVSVRNTRYAETVVIDLYKSISGGEVWIAALSLPVPISSSNKTTQFNFNYTFTAQDAQIGKVSFRAVATILNAPDAFPQDNAVISSPPTKVGR